MAVPADVLAKLPKGVAGALKERKTIVLGVFADDASNWRPMADDDRYVRNALKKTNRYDGEVFAKNISLSQLSTYGPLVNDLGVNQSPAVVVIDRNLKGTVLTGYVDRIAINQAIADARRDSITPAITDEYLRRPNEICAPLQRCCYSRCSCPTVRGKKARDAAIDRLPAHRPPVRRRGRSRRRRPAKWKSLKAALAAHDRRRRRDRRRSMIGAIKTRERRRAFLERLPRLRRQGRAAKLDRRFDEAGVTGCVVNRRS